MKKYWIIIGCVALLIAGAEVLCYRAQQQRKKVISGLPGQLAYIKNGVLYVSTANGTDVRQVFAPNETYEQLAQPRWSAEQKVLTVLALHRDPNKQQPWQILRINIADEVIIEPTVFLSHGPLTQASRQLDVIVQARGVIRRQSGDLLSNPMFTAPWYHFPNLTESNPISEAAWGPNQLYLYFRYCPLGTLFGCSIKVINVVTGESARLLHNVKDVDWK